MARSRRNPGGFRPVGPRLSLDVDAPDKVAPVLMTAADRFYEDAGELEGVWQEKSAGRPWEIIAKELEAAADRITVKLKRLGW